MKSPILQWSIFAVSVFIGVCICMLQKTLWRVPISKPTRVGSALLVCALCGSIAWEFMSFADSRIVAAGAMLGYWAVAAFFRTDDS